MGTQSVQLPSLSKSSVKSPDELLEELDELPEPLDEEPEELSPLLFFLKEQPVTSKVAETKHSKTIKNFFISVPCFLDYKNILT